MERLLKTELYCGGKYAWVDVNQMSHFANLDRLYCRGATGAGEIFPLLLLVFCLLTQISCTTINIPVESNIEKTRDASTDTYSSSTLRVMTLNMWNVSVLGFSWSPNIHLRTRTLIKHLSQNEPEIDIVLLQEMWEKSARVELLEDEAVKERFPFRFDAEGALGRSGLVVLSRYPILDEKAWFLQFRQGGDWWKLYEGDHFAGKGVTGFKIEFANHPVWIINTHLIACYDSSNKIECDQYDSNGRYRWDQINQLRDFVNNLAGPMPALIAGDFNFTLTSRYSQAIQNPSSRSALQRDDDFKDTITNYSNDRAWDATPEICRSEERIDFIWMRDGDNSKWGVAEPMAEVFSAPVSVSESIHTKLSDHPALMAGYCLLDSKAETSCETDATK
jgi:endonuclease/exonuclease/phosphatase family metal-dependent hydrolase